MKHICRFILGVMGLLAISASAFAEVTIAVVNIQDVIQKSPQLAVLNADLEKQFKPREAKIKLLQKEYENNVNILKRDGTKLTEVNRTELQNKITTDGNNLQAQSANFQRDLGAAQKQALEAVLVEVNKVITSINNEGKYTIILPASGVVAFNKNAAVDLTPGILEKLKKVK